jgi:hypothetical protein
VIPIYALCAFIAWTPSWDPIAEAPVPVHYFYEDALPPILAWNSEMEVCRVDYDVPHTYYVEGFNANGVSAPSETLTVVWPVPEPDAMAVLILGAWMVFWLSVFRRRRG